MAKTYKRKPTYIEAVQYSCDNVKEIDEFISSHNGRHYWDNDHTELYIFDAYGVEAKRVWPSDFIAFTNSSGFTIYSSKMFFRIYDEA